MTFNVGGRRDPCIPASGRAASFSRSLWLRRGRRGSSHGARDLTGRVSCTMYRHWAPVPKSTYRRGACAIRHHTYAPCSAPAPLQRRAMVPIATAGFIIVLIDRSLIAMTLHYLCEVRHAASSWLSDLSWICPHFFRFHFRALPGEVFRVVVTWSLLALPVRRRPRNPPVHVLCIVRFLPLLAVL
jgi:hypothetical protein